MKQDVISQMMEEFSSIAPSAAKVLISERDQYIAQKIFDESKKGKVLAVVGAGHINGIKKHLENQQLNVNLTELEQIPKKRLNIVKIIEVAIPVVFFGVIAWIIYSTGIDPWNKIKDIFIIWFLIHGILSGAGVAIARGHPLSILTAFVAAPFTSLEPFFAPGWIAGLVEVKLRKPLMKDFQELSKIESMRGFFRNKVIRLLMVVALANLGSMVGTIIALPWILSLGLG
jgi:pheromone shutdown-related protein TraB